MAATQTVFLKHTFIGKSTQDKPYTARAHSRYIQRESATHKVYTHLMPENYNARQRWFFDHENDLRKNGRVIDKFTISIPHEISQDHAIATLASFGRWLGQERAPFMFSLQGFDSPNHHAHFIFIDKDVETGQRIYGTTDRNSTRGIKLEWEKVANDMFAELGYDVRVKVKEGYELEAENDNELTPDAPAPAPDTSPEPPIETPAEDVQPDAEPMDDDSRIEVEGLSTAAANIKFMHTEAVNLYRLNDCRTRLEEARERHSYLVGQREALLREAGDFEETSLHTLQAAYEAKRQLAQHTDEQGRLRGLGFKTRSFSLFGMKVPEIDLRTSARRQAENAQYEYERAEEAAKIASHKRSSYEVRVQTLSNQVSDAELVAYDKQAELSRLFGTDEEMMDAETYSRNTLREVVTVISLAEARAAFEAEEITTDEYRTFLMEGGYQRELGLLEETMSEDGGLSL